MAAINKRTHILTALALILGAAAFAQAASAQSMAEVTARINRIASGEYAASVEAERARTPAVSRTQSQVRNAAKQAVLAELRDPTSAQFRNVRRITLENGTSVFCGEVNGRNGFGGYAGFVRFEAGVRRDADGDGFAQLDSQEPLTRAYFQSAWNQMCGRQQGVVVQF